MDDRDGWRKTVLAARHDECIRGTTNTIGTFETEEMYYGLIFPRVKQYKTIQDRLTIETFIA